MSTQTVSTDIAAVTDLVIQRQPCDVDRDETEAMVALVLNCAAEAADITSSTDLVMQRQPADVDRDETEALVALVLACAAEVTAGPVAGDGPPQCHFVDGRIRFTVETDRGIGWVSFGTQRDGLEWIGNLFTGPLSSVANRELLSKCEALTDSPLVRVWYQLGDGEREIVSVDDLG